MTKDPRKDRHLVWYRATAKQAAANVTSEHAKRWARIKDANATEAFYKLKEAFDQLAHECGLAAAIDIFEHNAAIGRFDLPRKPPGKPRGVAHDPNRDAVLLAMFDKNDPQSFWSLGQNNKIPMSKRSLANMSAKALGYQTGDQVLRRLKDLQRQHRAK